MKKVYLPVEVGSFVFLVFASKRERYTDDVVVKCKVDKATVYEDNTIYSCKPIKVVTKAGNKEIDKWVPSFMFENANINTGHCGAGDGELLYRVFTTKEACIKWLRG